MSVIRAWLILCVLAIGPIFFLSLSNVLNPIRPISERFLESFMTEAYLGSIQKIEREIQKLPESERQDGLSRIDEEFGYDLHLVTLASLKVEDKKKQRIKQGEIVYIDKNGEVIAYRIEGTDLILTIDVELSDVGGIYRIARGPVFFIRKDLEGLSEEEIINKLPQLEREYSLPFSLITKKESGLQMDKYKGKHVGDQIYWYQDEEGSDVLHFVLDNLESQGGKRLMIGPLNYQRYEWVGLTIFVGITVVLTLLCLLLWLLPLWRDHKRLNKAAVDFGLGRLESRVKVRKGSFSANVSQAFNSMADNIQNLIRTNQNLTNAVAHDLRTPLARLRFANEIMTLNNCSEEEIKRYRKTISSSIDSLDYLINQTLLHSRYNRAVDIKHFSKCRFASKIHEEVEQFSFDYEHLKFVTHIDNELAIKEQFIDDKALGRALSNLLSNAVKYANSIIRISYFVKNEYIHLQVQDDGKGIDLDCVDFILMPFSQLNNEERDLSNGHGLGLAIVNQIAKWHKGKVIIAQSELGGASVTLTIDSKMSLI